MKKILFCILLSLTAKLVSATAIVIIVTPQYILLGTDSKRQWIGASSAVYSEQRVCKIQSVGTYCFALAGLTSSQATRFSAAQVITRHLQEPGSYTKAVQRIKASLQAALQKDLQYRSRQQPETQALAAKEPLLEVVLLSKNNGVPQMEIIGFESGTGTTIKVGSYTARCPGDCPAGQQQLYFMGSYNKMEQLLAKQQPIAEPAALAEMLILEQAKATPTSVGAPVNLVRYSASGVEWIR